MSRFAMRIGEFVEDASSGLTKTQALAGLFGAFALLLIARHLFVTQSSETSTMVSIAGLEAQTKAVVLSLLGIVLLGGSLIALSKRISRE